MTAIWKQSSKFQHLLMNHQYPSAYSSFPNVKINPRLKIKPFLFVLDLIRCPDIGNLSNSELCVPIVYGHNYDCLDLCREKILRMREHGLDFIDVVDNPDVDLYLPRSSGDLNLTLANIGDIANTCKNYMKACCLIYEDNSSGEQRIYFSDDIIEIYERAAQEREKYYPFVGEEPFQRTYGAWNKRKDTRSLVDVSVLDAVGAKEGVVLSQFYKLCGNQLIDELPDEFVGAMTAGYGFSKDEIVEIISPHMGNSIDFFEATFLDSSRGGVSTALTFEKALTDLMHKKFGFFAKHTGQLRRAAGVGGYSDVFLVADSFNKCAILDAKASPSYVLSSDDYSKLVSNYIPNYSELLDTFDETRGKNIELEFCSYVAGGFRGDISYKLQQAHSATDVPCSAIKARDLLRLAKDGVSQSALRGRLSDVRLLSE